MSESRLCFHVYRVILEVVTQLRVFVHIVLLLFLLLWFVILFSELRLGLSPRTLLLLGVCIGLYYRVEIEYLIEEEVDVRIIHHRFASRYVTEEGAEFLVLLSELVQLDCSYGRCDECSGEKSH